MTTQVWRVVCEGGEVREVTATKLVGRWRAEHGDDGEEGNTARDAVVWRASAYNWPVVEIVAPGAQTADERLAQVTAERDKARADLACALAPNAADDALDAIAAACGCAEWEYPAQVQRDVLAVVKERDAAVAARDALAGAVREMIAASDERDERIMAMADNRRVCAARTALDAALAAAGGGA